MFRVERLFWPMVAVLLPALPFLLVGCSSDEELANELKKQQQQHELRGFQKRKSRDDLVSEAQEELARKNVDLVHELTEKLLASNPSDWEAIEISAKNLASMDEFVKAADRILEIPADDPNYGEASLRAASKWFSRVGHFYRAIECEQKLQAAYGDAAAKLRIAKLLCNCGMRAESVEKMREILFEKDLRKQGLNSLVNRSRTFFFPSVGRMNTTGDLLKEDLAEAWYFLENDENESALELSKALVERFPDAAISAFRGRVLVTTERYSEFRQWLLEQPSSLKNQPDFWRAMGTYCERHDQVAWAIRCFGEVVQLDPTDRLTYLSLSKLLNQMGLDENADEAFQRFELLKESHRIGNLVSENQDSPKDWAQLAKTLDALKRPFEALGWRTLEADVLKKEASSSQEARLRILASYQPPDTSWLVCGLDLKNWPVPSIDDVLAILPKSSRDVGNHKMAFSLEEISDRVDFSFQYDSGDVPGDNRIKIHHQTGGGIAVIDFERDGWPDIYLTQAGGPEMDPVGSGPNQFFRNLSGQRFIQVTEQTVTGDRGYGQGVAASDVNQDGFEDLVVANIGRNVIFINHGDGTFTRSELGEAPGNWTTSLAVGDLSGDGLPEVIEINYTNAPEAFEFECVETTPECSPRRFLAAADVAFSVGADGVIARSKLSDDLAKSRGHGYGGLIGNFDGRLGNELYVVNDTDANNYWRRDASRGEVRLVDSAMISGNALGIGGTMRGCMGLASGDIDRNGKIDFFITNFENEEVDLYLQGFSSEFRQESISYQLASISRAWVGWGTQAVDFDHDGWLDLAVLNGHVVDQSSMGRPFEMLPQLLKNEKDSFTQIRTPPGSFWSKKSLGRALATIDWNRDNKIDLIAGHPRFRHPMPCAVGDTRRAACSIEREARSEDETGPVIHAPSPGFGSVPGGRPTERGQDVSGG